MSSNMTASEVQARLAHWERYEAPKLQARVEAYFAPLIDKWVDVIRWYWMDQEIQQQRMTDDGCPLGI